MAKDPGDKLGNAQAINLNATPRSLRNSVGSRDRADVYRFNLTARSQLSLTFRSAATGASLRLLNSGGQQIARSDRRRLQSSISASLESGTYYLRIVPNRARVRATYRLTAAASPIAPLTDPIANTVPTIAAQSLTLQRGAALPINSSLLRAIDAQQSAAQLLYTLTAAPQVGQLLLNGVPVGAGGQFTQLDIDSGRLSYSSFPLRTQITSNSTNEIGEGLDGNNVIWNVSNRGAGIFDGFFSRTEAVRAFFYSGTTGTAVPLRTANTLSEIVLGISGDNAVWSGVDGRDGDIEVFLYSSATGSSTQLTDNQIDEIAVGISGNNATWNTFDGSPTMAAFFYNGTTGRTVRISHPNSISDQAIAVSGNKVVWSGFDGSDLEVFLYDATANTSVQLTDNDIDDIPESISGNNVIWNSLVSRTAVNAFFYNAATGQRSQLTVPGSTSAAARAISGNNVVWDAMINGTSEVFLYNAATNTSKRLTSNQINDDTFGMSGANVVYGSTQNNQTQVFFYSDETGATTPLNSPNIPALYSGVSGFNLALTLSDGTDTEIFLYNLRNAAPGDRFSFSVSDGAGGVAAGTFSIAIS